MFFPCCYRWLSSQKDNLVCCDVATAGNVNLQKLRLLFYIWMFLLNSWHRFWYEQKMKSWYEMYCVVFMLLIISLLMDYLVTSKKQMNYCSETWIGNRKVLGEGYVVKGDTLNDTYVIWIVRVRQLAGSPWCFARYFSFKTDWMRNWSKKLLKAEKRGLVRTSKSSSEPVHWHPLCLKVQ